MPNLRQCWDGISLVWHELRAEKSSIISTAAIWLDIENAHGSIPHQYIYHTRKHYGIDRPSLDLVTSYYNGLCSTSFFTK